VDAYAACSSVFARRLDLLEILQAASASMKSDLVTDSISLFVFFCILIIPFPFHITGVLLVIHSDSSEMYRLFLYILLFSLVSAIILQFIGVWKRERAKVLSFIYTFSCYYLALLLLKYGLDKIFLHQFYTPEPNTLFTPFGQMEKELLYWSVMGTSSFYSYFMGSLEVIAALLLLFKKTRLLALLFSFGILLNIIAVNFGFDISVKLYSLFLLFICICLLIPWLYSLYHFFMEKKSIPAPEPGLLRKSFAGMFLKWLAVGLIILEGFYPYFKSGNFNDRLAERPYLHGAYEIISVRTEHDSIPVLLSPIRRFFIHRKGYIIFQDRDDNMKDYKMAAQDSSLLLTDYRLKTNIVPFHFNVQDSLLILLYPVNGHAFELTGKAIDWKKLPALRKGIHWFSE
jgi:hypothetical protein